MRFFKIFGNSKSSEDDLDKLASFFSALGDPTTLRILKILSKRQEICVSDVAQALSSSISLVSHQMAKLRNLGLVRTQRDGKMICYYLEENPLVKIIEKEFLKNAA